MYTPVLITTSQKNSLSSFIFIWLHQVLVAACRLNSCGQQAQLPSGMWDLLRPEIKPMFPH